MGVRVVKQVISSWLFALLLLSLISFYWVDAWREAHNNRWCVSTSGKIHGPDSPYYELINKTHCYPSKTAARNSDIMRKLNAEGVEGRVP